MSYYDEIQFGYEFCVRQSLCLDLNDQLFVSYVLAVMTGAAVGALLHYIWIKFIQTPPIMKAGRDAE